MAIALVTHKGYAPGNGGGTSSSFDTTGATLLVMHVTCYFAGNDADWSDSKGNTWVARTLHSAGVNPTSRIYDCQNPTVGSGHTLTVNPDTNYMCLTLEAFSGTTTPTSFDQQNGSGGTGETSQNTGSITPSENNYLVVAGIATGIGSSSMTVDSSLTLTDNIDPVGGNNYGGAMGYIVQGTATAINPTFSWSGSVAADTSIASYQAAAGGGGATNTYTQASVGIGF